MHHLSAGQLLLDLADASLHFGGAVALAHLLADFLTGHLQGLRVLIQLPRNVDCGNQGERAREQQQGVTCESGGVREAHRDRLVAQPHQLACFGAQQQRRDDCDCSELRERLAELDGAPLGEHAAEAGDGVQPREVRSQDPEAQVPAPQHHGRCERRDRCQGEKRQAGGQGMEHR